MKSITLPCDTDAGDTVTLARIGGCAGVTVRAKQHQVNLTPADARQAAAWLVACADEVEASLADLRGRYLGCGDEPHEPTECGVYCLNCGKVLTDDELEAANAKAVTP